MIDEKIKDLILSISWFDKCGIEEALDLNLEIDQVKSWDEAYLCYSDSSWEQTTLEMRNEVTSYLNTRFPNRYLEWNLTAQECKKFLVESVFPKIRNYKETNGLDDTFLDCVYWDLLNSMVILSYQDCKPPRSYGLLFMIYEKGHFPCGWEGEWPKGRLKYY